MWVSFPISRHGRVVIPWFIAIPLIPIAAGLWVASLTFAAIGWVWHQTHPKPRRRGESRVSVRVTAKDS